MVYRDLKPENVLLDHEGHVRLTDFGLAKMGITNGIEGAHSFCGTPEYLAPEVLNRCGHGQAVDWWSLGSLLYEMITGLPPFYNRNRRKLFEKIRKSQLMFPKYISADARDLLTGLLAKDPSCRLGSNEDVLEIKTHRFFAPIDWDALLRGDVDPPWKPPISGVADTSTSQFDSEFTDLPVVTPPSAGGFQHADNNPELYRMYLDGRGGDNGASAGGGGGGGERPRSPDRFSGFSYTNDAGEVLEQAMRGGGDVSGRHQNAVAGGGADAPGSSGTDSTLLREWARSGPPPATPSPKRKGGGASDKAVLSAPEKNFVIGSP